MDFLGLRDAFDHQHHRTPHCGDVDRLKGRIQDQDRVLHNGWFSSRGTEHLAGASRPRFRQGFGRGVLPHGQMSSFCLVLIRRSRFWLHKGRQRSRNCHARHPDGPGSMKCPGARV